MDHISIIKRLYKNYSKKFIKRIIFSGFFAILVAASTSSIAWLLDPAIKKIFIEKDLTLIFFIPILIIIAFTTKGASLYFAKTIMIGVAEEIKKMLQMDSSGDLQQYKLTRMPHFQSGTNGISEDTSYLQALITTDMQAYASYKSPDKKLRYILSTNGTPSTGNARGSSMVDTKLNGSGNYQTRYVNTNDYRAQEFPNGSPVTQNTYTIRIYHA